MNIAYRKRLLISLLLSLLLLVLLNYIVLWFVEGKAASGQWYEEALSKQALLRAGGPYDYVFVGSSRTQNHINTQLMAVAGIRAFNMGLAGRQLENYYGVVDRAAQYANKAVVVSIMPHALFRTVKCARTDLGFKQILFYLFEQDSRVCVKELGLDMIKIALPINRFDAFVDMGTGLDIDQAKKTIASRYNYQLERDGRVVRTIRGNSERFVVLYKNGDGQVFSDSLAGQDEQQKEINWNKRQLHQEALAYLRLLGNRVQEQGKTMIVVIEPSVAGRVFRIDAKRLESLLPEGVELIDHSAIYYPLDLWADKWHLNEAGSRRYSRWLVDQLAEK
jgi:hypothetical protein